MYGTEWIAPAVSSATQLGGQLANTMYTANLANKYTNRARAYAQFVAKNQMSWAKQGMEKAGFNPILAMTGGAIHGQGAPSPIYGPMGEGFDARGIADDFSDIARDATMLPSEKEGREQSNVLQRWELMRQRWQNKAAEFMADKAGSEAVYARGNIDKQAEEIMNLRAARVNLDSQTKSNNARALLDSTEAGLRSRDVMHRDVMESLWRDVGAIGEGWRSRTEEFSSPHSPTRRFWEINTGQRYDLKTEEGRARWRREHR